MSEGTALFIVLLSLLFYFIPFITAWSGHNRNTTAIGVLNLLLGWTVLGWIVALIWAVMKDKEGSK